MPITAMATEENPPYDKSPSRASRVVCETLNYEQYPLHSHRSSKKPQQKTANDKLVWFAPVSSSLLSPGREKNLQTVRQKSRQGSIFSIQRRAKGAIEAEEPTSPKVSCIGQVRASKKNKEAVAEDSRRKTHQCKLGSASPARFFTSPGRQAIWGSLFSSRKEGSASPSPSGYGGGEVFCFGLPFDSPSVLGSDRNCGAFFAKSLVLLQERRDMAESGNDEVMQMYPHVPDNQQERRNSWAAAVPANQCANIHANPDAHGQVYPHVYGEPEASPGGNYSAFQKNGPHAYDKSYFKHAHEKPYAGKKPITHAKPYDPDKHAAHEVPSKEHHHEKTHGLKQKPTYEELPPLYCGVSNKQNLKISCEVVPETWLWRNGENLRPNGASHLNCLPKSSRISGREEPRKAQEEEATASSSLNDACSSTSSEAKECSKLQFPLDQSQAQAIHPKASNVEEKMIDFIPVDDTTCKPVEVDNEENNSVQHICTDEISCTHHSPKSSCIHMGTFDEEKKTCKIFESLDGAQDCNWQAQNLCLGEEHRSELDTIDMVKQRFLLGSFESKKGHPIPSKSGCGMERQNYGLPLPQLVENNLHSADPHEDAQGACGIGKGRKSEASPAQSFSALILVGYNLNVQSLSLNEARDKLANGEELLKESFEVGRLSFRGTGRHLRWLKGEAEFIRSHSATSYRTVIQLQRCNSEPCRSSC